MSLIGEDDVRLEPLAHWEIVCDSCWLARNKFLNGCPNCEAFYGGEIHADSTTTLRAAWLQHARDAAY